MRFTLNWLRDYVDFDLSPEQLAERLTMAGLEVEAVEYPGRGLDDIVVAQISEMGPHPNADKLTLCRVTDGYQDYKIVCGATNMKSGDKVALAKIGANLPPGPKFPEGLKIKKAKIRGEESFGMLCAEDELNIADESDGIMILSEGARLGNEIAEELGLDAPIFEVGITPNRPDCLSLIGTAREVAAILGTELKYPKLELIESDQDINELATVVIKDTKGCPRYSCRVIQGITIGPSPDWLKTRVESAGIRSINNIVDVTNFVMLEYGQPLHAFDYDLVEGHKIIVRTADEGETLLTLDGEKRTLSSEDVLISDGSCPVALAGVMGGGETEVSDNTVNVLIESAYFNPTSVRKTSKTTGLRSESSYRFERGTDPNGVVTALDRAAMLMNQVAGGTVAKGAVDIYPETITQSVVTLSVDRTNDVLGTELDPETVTTILSGIGIDTKELGPGQIECTVPTFRVDITRQIDLIEEVARLYGYDNISTTLPRVEMNTETPESRTVVEESFRQQLIRNGFLEVINYSFEGPQLLGIFDDVRHVEIMNPISQDSSLMRTSLFPSLLKNITYNLNHQAEDLRIFEIGHVYIPEQSELPRETKRLAAAATGRRAPELWSKENIDFFDMKAVFSGALGERLLSDTVEFQSASDIGYLHPGQSARITVKGKEIGVIGELHPEILEKLDVAKRVYIFEVDINSIVFYYDKTQKSFQSIPRYPSVRRDISIVVDEGIDAGSIVNEIRNIDNKLIEDVTVFDVFHGGSMTVGKKSVALSLHIRSVDRTLTDTEINEVQEKALNKLQLALGAELRTI